MDPIDASRREQRFSTLWAATYVDLLRFARRRVHPTHAEDLVEEVMLVAWRRLDDVPEESSQARAWLFHVARLTLQNARRREDRHRAVAVRLAELAPPSACTAESPDVIADRLDLVAAWPRLSAIHQESIALSVFEGLAAPQAAAVLGISPTAFRLRLSRARRALRLHLSFPRPDHETTGEPTTVRSHR